MKPREVAERCAEEGDRVRRNAVLIKNGLPPGAERDKWEGHSNGADEVAYAIRAYALTLPQAVPEGWKLVPVEATQAMVMALLGELSAAGGSQPMRVRSAYRAMLNAAPSAGTDAAPQQSEGTRGTGLPDAGRSEQADAALSLGRPAAAAAAPEGTATPLCDDYQARTFVAEILKHPTREWNALLERAKGLERELAAAKHDIDVATQQATAEGMEEAAKMCDSKARICRQLGLSDDLERANAYEGAAAAIRSAAQGMRGRG